MKHSLLTARKLLSILNCRSGQPAAEINLKFVVLSCAQAMERQQQEKRMAKWDMDRVIDKFEQRRRAWSSPQRRE